MFGIYINNNPLIAPFIGVYPTEDLIVKVVYYITGEYITSSEISASIAIADVFIKKINSTQIVVTPVPDDLVTFCSKYGGATVRVREELLKRRPL